MREISPKLKAERAFLDTTVETLEISTNYFTRETETESDIDNIHMEHKIAREYLHILTEAYPGKETMYEDDIINAIGEMGLHYTYLTGKIIYVAQIHGHRMYAIL